MKTVPLSVGEKNIPPRHLSPSVPTALPAVRLSAQDMALYDNYYRDTRQDRWLRHFIQHSYKRRWSHDDFPWQTNVRENLRQNIDGMTSPQLLRLARMALPLVEGFPPHKLREIKTSGLPTNPRELEALKTVLVNRQLEALKAIANHALTAEQSAVAPLSTAIISWRRYPAIQEAATLFVADESRHSAIFERYLVDKLGGKRQIRKRFVTENDRYLRIAPYMPGASVFLALAIETVGGAFFEFFAQRAPDPLFREICRKIAVADERRHMLICRGLYRVVHDPKKQTWLGRKYEHFRNRKAMEVIAKAIYADSASRDGYLMKSVMALGIDPNDLLGYIGKRLNHQYKRIGFPFDPALIPRAQFAQ